jgi:hypothetical protein
MITLHTVRSRRPLWNFNPYMTQVRDVIGHRG